MAQLRWGARQSLDAIYDDLRDIIDVASDDPGLVRKLARRIKERIEDDIEPKLQRAGGAPSLEQRVAELEERLKKAGF